MFFSFPCSCHVQSKCINLNIVSGIESILSIGNDNFLEKKYLLNLLAFINFFQDNVVVSND